MLWCSMLIEHECLLRVDIKLRDELSQRHNNNKNLIHIEKSC